MPKKIFETSQIKKITGATQSEKIKLPSYYAPPFLDEIRDKLKSHLSSKGGRPTIEGADIVRKVRFTEKEWDKLKKIAKKWSNSGGAVSPAQVASSVVKELINS